MEQRLLKRLKDFPRDTWMEAADKCPVCEGPYMYKVTYVDDEGNLGDILVKAHHREDCPEVLEMGPYGPDMGDSWDRRDLVGWEYAEESVTVAGVEWMPLRAKANVALCLNCQELVVGIPIVLYLDEGEKGELDFCERCAKDLGVLDALTRGPDMKNHVEEDP